MEPREVVVVEAVRTPTGKSGWAGAAKGGVFSKVSAQHLLATALRGLVERVRERSRSFDEREIEDVAVGCLSQIGEQGLNLGRMGVLAADLPDEVAGWTCNRYCNAGLQAINSQAHALACGAGEIAIAAGVESMSRYAMGSDFMAAGQAGLPANLHPRAIERGALNPMGVSAQMVADRYGLSREDMDRFSLWSHQKAVQAMRDEEWYHKRVVSLEVEDEDGNKMIVDEDEPPRPQALDDPEGAYEKMASLPPRFKEGGTVTAGNSSAIVDGAAAVMLMISEKAEELGLEPLARIVSTAVAGSEPLIMLLGPIPAMRKALDRAGITMEDIDVFEPNEAFASPVLAFCRELDLDFDDPRINPTGGAISIGHPIGCSGVLYFTEMVHHMARHKLRYGLQTLCGGGGVGIATIVERI
jgi:acetyl-CoA acyltransferase